MNTILLDLLIIVSLQLLATTVYVKNKRETLNRTFILCVSSISLWIISNYFGNDISMPEEQALLANRFIFFFSTFAVLYLYKFSIDLTADNQFGRSYRYIRTYAYIVAIFSGSSLLVADVHPQHGIYAITFGLFTPIYGLTLFGLLGLTLYILWRNYKRTEGYLKIRIKLFLTTLLICVPLLLLLQFILPTVTKNFTLANVGVWSILIPIYGLYYAVAKHRLFDLRLVIVRSVTYVMAVGLITTAYSFLAYFAQSFFNNHDNETLRLVANVGLVLLVVLSYQPLKESFKRLTYRIFYQDAYDPQNFYASLNKTVVSTININQLIRRATPLIKQTFNLDTVVVVLKPESGLLHIGGSGEHEMDEVAAEKLLHLQLPRKKIIISETLDNSYQSAKSVLDDNNISAIIRLETRGKEKELELGYLALGFRKSGYSYRPQDLQVLGSAADELAVAMHNALLFEEIQNFNMTLQQKVDEATRKYRTANEKLKKLDETKDEFISMASHQLRTPLTSVKGYLSMVLEGDAGPLRPQQQELLKQSFMSSQRMVNLIADLLNLSRLNTGKFVIDAAPTDLRVIVDQEVAQLRETARAKDIEVVWNMPPSFSLLNLDENKMHQVVMNFIDNALYYTPNGGRVEVSLTETATAVEYRVKDNGIGVPRELQRHLFTKFYRADNARRMRPDGTGLGLYMAQKVVVAQGGTVLFESQEGKGSTFGFRFNKNKK